LRGIKFENQDELDLFQKDFKELKKQMSKASSYLLKVFGNFPFFFWSMYFQKIQSQKFVRILGKGKLERYFFFPLTVFIKKSKPLID